MTFSTKSKEHEMAMKSAHEWLNDPRIQDCQGKVIRIVDADGWRRLDGVQMDDLISWDDFRERFNQCTIMSCHEDAETHPTPA